jgi:hypothetical protein
MSLTNFASTVETFFGSNFYGLVTVTTNIPQQNSDYIAICAEQTAYLFKLLVMCVSRDAPLHIDMSCDGENKFVIKIESRAFEDMSKSEIYDIVRAAKNAKFVPYETASAIILKRSYKTAISYRIYATSKGALRDAFNKIFFNRGKD